MEGTEAGEVLRARLLELDVVTDDADDVGLLLEGVFEVGGGHGSVDTQPSTSAKAGAATFLLWGMEGWMGNGRVGVDGCGRLWRRAAGAHLGGTEREDRDLPLKDSRQPWRSLANTG